MCSICVFAPLVCWRYVWCVTFSLPLWGKQADSVGSLMHHLWQKGSGLNQGIQHTHINPDSLDTSQSSWDTVWVEGLEMCTFWKCPWCFRHFSGLVSSLSDDLWFQPWWNKKQYLPQSSGFCGIIEHALLLIIATIGFQLITSLLPNVTAYSLVESKLMITNHLPEEAAGPYSCILFLFCSWRRIIMKI